MSQQCPKCFRARRRPGAEEEVARLSEESVGGGDGDGIHHLRTRWDEDRGLPAFKDQVAIRSAPKAAAPAAASTSADVVVNEGRTRSSRNSSDGIMSLQITATETILVPFALLLLRRTISGRTRRKRHGHSRRDAGARHSPTRPGSNSLWQWRLLL